MRIPFIRKQITEEKFKTEMYFRERNNEKMLAEMQLYEMYGSVMVDNLHKLRTDNCNVQRVMNEIAALRVYFNKNSADIRRRFGTITKILK